MAGLTTSQAALVALEALPSHPPVWGLHGWQQPCRHGPRSNWVFTDSFINIRCVPFMFAIEIRCCIWHSQFRGQRHFLLSLFVFLERGARNISEVPKQAPLKISISLCTQESNRQEPVSNSFTFCVIWRKTDSYIQSGLFQKIVLWKMKDCSKVKSDYFRWNEKLQCQPYCLNQQKIKALQRIGNWRFSLNLHFFLLSTFLLKRERTS